MIILNPKKINSKITLYENICKYNEIDAYVLDLKCPYCDSNNTIKWGSYNRNIYYLKDNKIIYDAISIKRIKCKTCGKTHALIPAYIIPYKQNGLDVILTAISNKNNYLDLDINYDTMTNWIKLFNKILPFLKTMFNNISKHMIINYILNNIYYVYYQFYQINHFILMLSHKAIYNMAHF